MLSQGVSLFRSEHGGSTVLAVQPHALLLREVEIPCRGEAGGGGATKRLCNGSSLRQATLVTEHERRSEARERTETVEHGFISISFHQI